MEDYRIRPLDVWLIQCRPMAHAQSW